MEGDGNMAEKELKINFEELPEFIKEAIDIKTAKIKDYISGEWVEATPEEVEAVQIFARRLVEDYDYPKEQIQTHPQFRVRRRPSDERREYPVDIAVFKSNRKVESQLFMIVECKQPNKRRGIRQLKIYMDLSPAVIGVWFNGKEHAYIRKIQKIDGTLDYVEIPNIPKRGQRIEDIGLFKRKDLKPTRNLKAVFKDIRNHLSQQAVGITRDEVLAQEVMNLLFCKIYDEINTAPDEIVTFRSGINEDLHDVASRIKALFERVKEEYSDIFEENDNINLDDNSINYVVGELQNYCIIEAERDVLGDAFEVFIGPALKGAQGQFFTPRNVVRLAVRILDPTPGEVIIDPACGSGGFLIVALEDVWDKIKMDAEKRGFSQEWVRQKQKDIANRCIRGIDKDSFLAKVTKAYMAIVGDGRGGIFCENSLEPPNSWHRKSKEKISVNSFDILLTNPPFGSKIPIKEREILEQFELGYKWKKKKKGEVWEKKQEIQEKQPPQVLFIERCLELLKPAGRMAIVLPDGVLGGSRVGYIAHFIRQNAKILALVDCPKETFQPFVSTKTHLVFLQKKTVEEKEEDKEYPVFMAIADFVGHDSKGKPLFREENGVKVINDDFPKITAKYEEFREGNLTRDKFNRYGYVVSSKWLENYLVARRYLPKYIDVLEEIENLERQGKVELKTIGEIKKELFTGANIDAKEYVETSPYRYVMTDCVTEFGINPGKFKFITEKAYRDNINKTVKTGDIIINRTGNPGVTVIVPEDMESVMACGFVFVLRLKEKYDPYYVAAFLNSRFGKLQMERFSFGSLLDHITKDDLEKVLIVFPKDKKLMDKITNNFKEVIENQMKARLGLNKVYNEFENFKK